MGGGATPLSGAAGQDGEGGKEATEPADAESDGADGSEPPPAARSDTYGCVADAWWENKTRSNVKALHSIT